MFLFSEEMTNSEIIEESVLLECDTLAHQAFEACDMYEQSCYLEATGEDNSVEKRQAGSSIVDKIKGILKRISEMIESFRQSVLDSSKSKKKLTANEFMNSESTQVRLRYDVLKLQQELDEEYLASRKIVGKIANAVNKGSFGVIDAKAVESYCDKMEQKIHDNEHRIVPTAKAAVNAAAIEKLRKEMRTKILESKGITDQLEDITKKYSDMERKTLGVPTKSEIKERQKASTESKESSSKFYRAMTRLSNTQAKLVSRWKKLYEFANGEVMHDEVRRATK